jgi:hypothetical protein
VKNTAKAGIANEPRLTPFEYDFNHRRSIGPGQSNTAKAAMKMIEAGSALLSMCCGSQIQWLPTLRAALISGKIADMAVPKASPRSIGFRSSFASFQGKFFDSTRFPTFVASQSS